MHAQVLENIFILITWMVTGVLVLIRLAGVVFFIPTDPGIR